MENQTSGENTESKIICRKCQGPHFTIKCGKEKSVPVENKEIVKPKPVEKNYNKNQKQKTWFKTTYRVKLSELPTDISEEELRELTCDWGHIAKIRVNKYNESSVAYIDFGYEEEADYFIKAIDKTPFDYLIISAQRAEVRIN